MNKTIVFGAMILVLASMAYAYPTSTDEYDALMRFANGGANDCVFRENAYPNGTVFSTLRGFYWQRDENTVKCIPGQRAHHSKKKPVTAVTTTPVANTIIIPPAVCGETPVVSNEDNLLGDNTRAVLTYQHPVWTANIPGASWIWSDALVKNPTGDETKTFTRIINVTETENVAATLTIASDNSNKVYINGVLVATHAGENNYASTMQSTTSIAAFLHEGLNNLTIEVKNWAAPNSDPTTNPAGLLYSVTCEDIPPVCFDRIISIPAVCEGGKVTKDEMKHDGCRYITCEEERFHTMGGHGHPSQQDKLSVKVCEKPDHGKKTSYEMYRQQKVGDNMSICLGDACVTSDDSFDRAALPACMTGTTTIA